MFSAWIAPIAPLLRLAAITNVTVAARTASRISPAAVEKIKQFARAFPRPLSTARDHQKMSATKRERDDDLEKPGKTARLDDASAEGGDPGETAAAAAAAAEGAEMTNNDLNEDNNNEEAADVETGEGGVADVRHKSMSYLLIRGLTKFAMPKEVKSWLTGLGVPFQNVKKSPKWAHCYVGFPSAEAADVAIKILEGKQFRKNAVTTEPAVWSGSGLVGNSGFGSSGGGKRGGNVEHAMKFLPARVDPNDQRTPAEKINDKVTPYWRLTYDEQLKKKQEHVTETLHMMRDAIVKAVSPENPVEADHWLSNPIVQEDIHGSSIVMHYRNKCEFTAGKNSQGERTLGFLLGLYKEGIVSVESALECVHVQVVAKNIVRVLDAYIKTSKFETYDRVLQRGYWRQVTLRTHISGDVMVIFQVNETGLTDDEKTAEKASVLQHLLSHQEGLPEIPESGYKITSVYWQPNNTIGTAGNFPMTLIHGDPHIFENLLGLRFRIAPTAFFQANTAATEVLYTIVRQWAAADADTTVLDICCGTGTIGLTMANHVKKVIGVEIVPEAVQDAKLNAELNGINNVEFIASKAEDAIKNIVASLDPGQNVVAILDPPRAGMHKSVLDAIRRCSQIKRLVYVACDARNSMPNFVDLCRNTSKRFQGDPFRIVKTTSVDLFPHTDHVEIVFLLER